MNAAALSNAIAQQAKDLPEMTLMEVCGTHTHAMHRYGIRQLLPQNIRLISGPGCPVCVTDDADLVAAFWIAKQKNVVLCCFGDMLRVPCGGESLLSLAAAGANVRVCVSPLEALTIAREEPQKHVVWFGIGFETTLPHTAALIEAAHHHAVKNLFVQSAHKTMPAALRALLRGACRVDGLLCPGHVAVITGAEAFRFVPQELSLPAAVAGFEAEDLLLAILALVSMLREGKPALVNAYPRAVKSAGNETARALVDKVFEPCDAVWRGLGLLTQSGLAIRPAYAAFDAAKRFSAPKIALSQATGCRCGDILKGLAQPPDCPCFGTSCTPMNPLGACMVSTQGACAAYNTYIGAL